MMTTREIENPSQALKFALWPFGGYQGSAPVRQRAHAEI